MKLALILLFTIVFSESSTINLKELRDAYQHAKNSQKITLSIIEKINNHHSQTPILLGYKGAATMILAKFQYSPLSKLDSFNKGKELLEQAIQEDKNNIELLYIRFSIQTNAPMFLDYNNNINHDKQYILTHIQYVKDVDLKKRIINFLQSSTYLTKNERNSIN